MQWLRCQGQARLDVNTDLPAVPVPLPNLCVHQSCMREARRPTGKQQFPRRPLQQRVVERPATEHQAMGRMPGTVLTLSLINIVC